MSFRQALNQLKRDERGGAVVEAVFVLPVLLMMGMACVEVTRYVLFHQKLDKAAISLGDLTSQARGLSAAELTSLTDAARQIMLPFDLSTNGGVVVSSISAPDSGSPQVNWQWSDGAIASDLAPGGSSINLPSGFVVRANESIITSEVRYNFTPLFVGGAIGADQAYSFSIHRPRFDPLTSLDP